MQRQRAPRPEAAEAHGSRICAHLLGYNVAELAVRRPSWPGRAGGPFEVSPKLASWGECRMHISIGTEPSVIIRILIGLSLFAFGFYLGRELQRTAPIRDELAAKRKAWEDQDSE